MRYTHASALMSLALGLGAATASYAEDGAEKATFRLTTNGLRYASTKSESKPDSGSSTKTESTGLQTFSQLPMSFEAALWTQGYAFYLYPGQAGLSLWAGKAIGDTLEVGATLGLNSKKVKDGADTAASNIGAYVWTVFPVAGTNVEVNVNPYLKSGKTADDEKLGTVKDTSSGYGLYFDAYAIFPIAKNVDYAAGIDYTMESVKYKTGKNTDTFSELGVVLGRFRIVL